MTDNRPPQDGHRWVSVRDEAGELWLFDATFLLSDFQCIYGNGCQSIEPEPDHTESLGCCVHGAHFVDQEDLDDVAGFAALLTGDQWQYRNRSIRKGGPFKKNKDGDWVTRKAAGACIFLNRAGFEGGAGCALHRAALERGERPLDWKPDVCWQVPIRLDIHTDDHGRDTVFVRAWERHDWGDGGEEFNWWCIEAPEAYSSSRALYLTSKDELIELVGQEVYRLAAFELGRLQDERAVLSTSQNSTPVSLGSTSTAPTADSSAMS